MDTKQFIAAFAPLVGGDGNISSSNLRGDRLLLALKDCDAVQMEALQAAPGVARAELTRNRLWITLTSEQTATEETIMAKNYPEIARFIVEKVGGKENVETYTHCITRLRFVLRDRSKAADAELKAHPTILSIVDQGGQYQLVIGNEVEKVYNAVKDILGDLDAPASTPKAETEKKKQPERVREVNGKSVK